MTYFYAWIIFTIGALAGLVVGLLVGASGRD
jgi:hypothetical protein